MKDIVKIVKKSVPPEIAKQFEYARNTEACRDTLMTKWEILRRVIGELAESTNWTPEAAKSALMELDAFQGQSGELLLTLRWYLNDAAHPKS